VHNERKQFAQLEVTILDSGPLAGRFNVIRETPESSAKLTSAKMIARLVFRCTASMSLIGANSQVALTSVADEARRSR
jgi:hypothetical protein